MIEDNRISKVLPFYKLTCWSNIKNNFKIIKRRIKMAHQRIKYGCSFADIWNFDFYLASIFEHGCSQLAENSHSHPVDMTEEEWAEKLRKAASNARIISSAYATEELENKIDELTEELYWSKEEPENAKREYSVVNKEFHAAIREDQRIKDKAKAELLFFLRDNFSNLWD